MSIEEITVMYPYMVIVLLEAYVITLVTVAVHVCKVPDFNI
jgi:hypothetical protein